MAERPKIAALGTIYFKFSHSQHIVDRFLEGYGWNGTWHKPPMDLVSLYVDQVGDNDVSRERLGRHAQVRASKTIEDALTLGTGKLAVDGVLLIGEHGKYPRTPQNQVQYPRYEFFQEIVKVYRASNKTAPVFNDKHLSYRWDWSKEMYDTARTMNFGLMAGSSLPVTWRTPSLEFPTGAAVREAVCVAYGGVDSYDFHALETLQCMVERRKGGESGVTWLQAYRGDKFWEAMREGVWSRRLMDAAICRSHTLNQARPGFNDRFPTPDEMRQLVKEPVAYTYQHADGLRATMLLMNGLVQDFNFAADMGNRVLSTQMYLPMPPARTSLANFFSPLVNNIEQLFLTGRSPYPIERTLLTTGLTASGVDSLARGQQRIETPHLAIKYPAPTTSTFWRT